MCLLEAMRPFEAALLDYLAGRPVKLLIEAAQGVKDVHPTAIYAHPYEKWPVLHQQMVRLARGLVLDLGCGVGRHLLYLQAKGLQVVGLEIAPGLAKACSERGAEHVMVADMRCLPFRDASFDTIMCLGNTLGVGGSPAGVLAILRELLRKAETFGLGTPHFIVVDESAPVIHVVAKDGSVKGIESYGKYAVAAFWAGVLSSYYGRKLKARDVTYSPETGEVRCKVGPA